MIFSLSLQSESEDSLVEEAVEECGRAEQPADSVEVGRLGFRNVDDVARSKRDILRGVALADKPDDVHLNAIIDSGHAGSLADDQRLAEPGSGWDFATGLGQCILNRHRLFVIENAGPWDLANNQDLVVRFGDAEHVPILDDVVLAGISLLANRVEVDRDEFAAVRPS